MFPTQAALWNLGLLSIWCAPGALAATVSLFPEGLSPGNSLRGEVVGTGGGLTTYVLSGLTAGIPFTVTVAEDASRVAENIAIPSLSILAHVGCVATGGGNAVCEKVVGIGSGQSATLTTVESFAPFPIAVTSAAAATTTLTTTSTHVSTTTASTTRPTSTTVSASGTSSTSVSVSVSSSGSTTALSTVTSSAVQSFTPTTSISLATSTSPASTVSTAPATASSSAAAPMAFENTLLAHATAAFWSLLTIFTLSAI